MSDDPRTVHDPVVLRAIAHPLRNRILGELSATGPMRAADVARALDVPANQASFHLRQLAKYGLVEEDPDAARDRRDRVWRVVAEDGLSLDLAAMAAAPGGDAAVAVYRRSGAARSHALVDHAWGVVRPPTEDGAPVHQVLSDTQLRLSQDEARAFSAALTDLVEQWLQRTRAAGAPDDGRRTYVVHQMLLPEPAPDRPDPS